MVVCEVGAGVVVVGAGVVVGAAVVVVGAAVGPSIWTVTNRMAIAPFLNTVFVHSVLK